METKQLLDSITQRVGVLVAEQVALRSQLTAAQARIRELEEQLSDQTERALDLHHHESIGRIAGSIAADPAAATELKLRINDYLRELERCIAYLKD